MSTSETAGTKMAAAKAEAAPFLEITDLHVSFPVEHGFLFRRQVGVVRAVDGVTFPVRRGEVFGLVGESGSGKSTLGRAIVGLTRAQSGSVRFDGSELLGLSPERRRPFCSRIQIIFQDPYSSLNPRTTVFDILAEPLRVHERLDRTGIQRKVASMLERVGLTAAHMNRFPHEFSGGQRQRIAIARALMVRPDLIIADEPVSALDVSIQAQILNLLADIRREMGLTMIFISHDLAVVQYVSDIVGVMYLGRLVEIAPPGRLYSRPLHPYTQALISAAPEIDPARRRTRMLLKGNIPSPGSPPSGCKFHPRCPYAEARCAQEEPPLDEVSHGHRSACWFSSRFV